MSGIQGMASGGSIALGWGVPHAVRCRRTPSHAGSGFAPWFGDAPPCFTMAMVTAMSPSVTVSMGEDTMGVRILMFLVMLVERSTLQAWRIWGERVLLHALGRDPTHPHATCPRTRAPQS